MSSRRASTGGQQCTIEVAELRICLSVCLEHWLVNWAVLGAEPGDGGQAPHDIQVEGMTYHVDAAANGRQCSDDAGDAEGAGRFCRECLLELGGQW